MVGGGVYQWTGSVLEQCEKVYGDESPWRDVSPRVVAMPDASVNVVMSEVQHALEKGVVEWTTKRHKHYPTRDIPVESKTLPVTSVMVKELLTNVLAPVYEQHYPGVNASDLTFQEAFVVRYGTESGGQRNLDAHVDGSPLSFVCALNDEYEGGGTHLTKLDETCKPKKGQCCIFAGGVQEHKGLAITSGERYLLTGFVNFGPTQTECEHLENLLDED